jgi:hypothetical protein
VYHGLAPLACSDAELISETMNPSRHFGSIPSTGDRKASKFIGQQNTENAAYIHASSGIQTHDPSVRTVEYRKVTKLHGHWDRHHNILRKKCYKTASVSFGLCGCEMWVMGERDEKNSSF